MRALVLPALFIHDFLCLVPLVSVAGRLVAIRADVYHDIADDGEVSAVPGDLEVLAIVPEVVDGAAVFSAVKQYVMILVARMPGSVYGHRVVIHRMRAGFFEEVALALRFFQSVPYSAARQATGWRGWWDSCWGFVCRAMYGNGLVDAIGKSLFHYDSSL